MRLFDVGPVTYPAYPQTSLNVRSLFEAKGIDPFALDGLALRAANGRHLGDADLDLLQSALDALRSYLPESVPPDKHPESKDVAPAGLAIRRKKLELKLRETITLTGTRHSPERGISPRSVSTGKQAFLFEKDGTVKIVELKQKRAKIVEEQRGILDKAEAEKRGMSPEETARYEALEKDFDRLTEDIAREEKLQKRGTRTGRS